MEMVKKVGVLLVAGFLLGATVSTLIAPAVLAWYNTGSDANALCNCANVAKGVTAQLIRAQLIGGLIGAVLVTAAGIVISRIRAAAKPAVKPPA